MDGVEGEAAGEEEDGQEGGRGGWEEERKEVEEKEEGKSNSLLKQLLCKTRFCQLFDGQVERWGSSLI